MLFYSIGYVYCFFFNHFVTDEGGRKSGETPFQNLFRRLISKVRYTDNRCTFFSLKWRTPLFPIWLHTIFLQEYIPCMTNWLITAQVINLLKKLKTCTVIDFNAQVVDYPASYQPLLLRVNSVVSSHVQM